MKVVKSHFDVDTESSACDRFLIHCRFFAQRVVNDEYLESNLDKNLQTYLMFVENHKKQNACINEIANLIHEKYNYKMNVDEKFYILLHLVKFTEY
jgi:beta-glucoside operon transcriptional antiterminator